MIDNLPVATGQSSQGREGFDVQVSTAKRYPRDEEKSLAKSIKHSIRNRKTAKRCFYFRPVGKDSQGRIAFTPPGIAIRGVENIAHNWGNLWIGAISRGVVDGKLTVTGVSFDIEANVRIEKDVTKSVTRTNGQLYSANHIATMEQALASTAVRNAVLANLPDYVKEEFKEAVIEYIAGDSQDKIDENWEILLQAFEQYSCTDKELRELCHIKPKAVIDGENIVFLTGVYNGLEEDLFKIEDALGYDPSKQDPPVKDQKPAEKKKAPAASNKKKPVAKDKKQPAKAKNQKKDQPTPEEVEEDDSQQPINPQNSTQKYNTLLLQLENLVGGLQKDKFLKQFQSPRKFNALVNNWTAAQKAEVIPHLEYAIKEEEKLLNAKEE